MEISFKPIFSSKLVQNNFIRSNKLERCPMQDTVSFSGIHKNEGLTDEIRKMLDERVFEFEKDDGEIFEGTIREYLNSSLMLYRDSIGGTTLIHCTHDKETAAKIKAEGLDWTKTNRMKCGPGTYFTMSYGAGEEHGAGGVPVEAAYIGNKDKFPVFECKYYEAIDYNEDISKAVKEIDKSANPTKVINQYCHDILCDEMGIDYLYASTGRAGGSYVVLNDDCMKIL